MDEKWKDIVKAVAPGLAGMLGGPLAATAVGAISQGLLGKPDGTSEELAAVVSGGTPEVLVKLKQISAELEGKLSEAGIQLESIAAGDRESARSREVAVKDSTPRILAYVFVAGYFLLVGGVARWGLPTDSREIMISLISILSASLLAILNYYYGTSKSSADKNAIISKLSE